MKHWHLIRRNPFFYGLSVTLCRSAPVITILASSLILDDLSFGKLAVVATAIATASLLADSGLDNAATWTISRSPDCQINRSLLSSLAWTRIAIASIASLFFIAPHAASLTSTSTEYLLLLSSTLLSGVLSAVAAATRVVLRLNLGGEIYSLAKEKITSALLFLLALIALGKTSVDKVWLYPLCCCAGASVALIGAPIPSLKPSFHSARTLLVSASPFIISTLCAAAIWRAPIMILANAGDFIQVGYLALAIYPITLLSSASVLATPILLIKNPASNRSEISTLKHASVIGLLLSGLFFVSCLAILEMDQNYVDRNAITLSIALSPVVALLWINPIAATFARTQIGVWSPAPASLVAALAGVILTLLLTPRASSYGAVLAILSAEALITIMLIRIIMKHRRDELDCSRN